MAIFFFKTYLRELTCARDGGWARERQRERERIWSWLPIECGAPAYWVGNSKSSKLAWSYHLRSWPELKPGFGCSSSWASQTPLKWLFLFSLLKPVESHAISILFSRFFFFLKGNISNRWDCVPCVLMILLSIILGLTDFSFSLLSFPAPFVSEGLVRDRLYSNMSRGSLI